MENAISEMPLVIFSTLALIGAGAFLPLGLAYASGSLKTDSYQKIDKLTVLPLAIVIIGFIAAFFHLASPMKAAGALAGIGASGLSNEVLVGIVFVVLALVYVIVSIAKTPQGGTRTAFCLIVGVVGIVFALFIGIAYMMPGVPAWDTPLAPVGTVGLALVGGSTIGMLIAWVSGAFDAAAAGAFKTVIIACSIIGAIAAIAALGGQAAIAGSISTPLASGADAVSAGMPLLIAAIVFVLAAAALACVAVAKKSSAATVYGAVVCALVGVFTARMFFYCLQISFGL